MMIIRKVIGVSLLVWGLAVMHLPALTVAPGYQIVTMDPGQKTKIQVTVTNSEKNALQIQAGSKNWFVTPWNAKYEAKDWLRVDETIFQLQPGESKSVDFEVEAPSEAKGELIGMATFLFDNVVDPSSLHKRLSVAVYCAVRGTEEYKYKTLETVIDTSTDKLSAGVRIKNTGNVHIRLSGHIRIYSRKDKKLLAEVFVPSARPIYPGKSKILSGSIAGLKLSPGKYYAKAYLTDVDRKQNVETRKKNFKVKKKKRQIVIK